MIIEGDESINDCIYTTRLGSGNFKEAPKFLYFYRLSVSQGGKLEVGSYFFHQGDPGDSLEKIRSDAVRAIEPHSAGCGVGSIDWAVEQIAQIAASDKDPKNPSPWRQDCAPWKPYVGNLNNLKWRIRSYAAFMFDDPAWQIPLGGAAEPAIYFEPARNGKSGNHTFYDAHEQVVKLPSGRDGNVICMINHMKKDAQGQDHMGKGKGDAPQLFKFNILADMALADGSGSVRVIIDPMDENEGPP